MRSAAWTLRNLCYRHRGAERRAVSGVGLDIETARITALLGPNGAGKSTLLELLLGTRTPDDGTVTFRGRAVVSWSRRALAREIGVVPQGEADPSFTVREIVAMGRYPHLGLFRRERDEDERAIARAMARCDVERFADRWISSLSAGERQRVRLARAIAQEASVLVLDEPTTSLDIRHEMATFELLRELRRDGATVVVVSHNLNLAARYADTLVLMEGGRVVAHGCAGHVLTAEIVSAVYQWPVSILPYDGGEAPQVVPRARATP